MLIFILDAGSPESGVGGFPGYHAGGVDKGGFGGGGAFHGHLRGAVCDGRLADIYTGLVNS